jgi:two-component system, cell cycle response regulator
LSVPKPLTRQYGKGIYPQDPRDDIDRAVLRDGKAIENDFGTLFSDTLYRLSIPYVASEKGKIDCLSCHDAKVGDVLGAVSIEMEINDLKVTGLISAFVAMAILIGLSYYLLRNVRRFIASYKETLDEVAMRWKKLMRGRLHARRSPIGNEDGYPAAMWTNAVNGKTGLLLQQ